MKFYSNAKQDEFVANILNFKNKLLKYTFLTISILLIVYNSLFFLDKFYERKLETIKHDNNLDDNINAYLFKKEDIKENNLDKYSQRFINQIKLSVDNKILKIKYPD